jgi:cytochrome P450
LIRADFAVLIHYFSLDTISQLSFGTSFGYLENDGDLHDWIQTTKDHLPVLGVLGTLPTLARIANNKWVRKVTGPWDTDKKGIGKILGCVLPPSNIIFLLITVSIHRLAKNVVAERFGPEKVENHDMLGSFIRRGLTQTEAQVEAVTQIVAGNDQPSTWIRMTILYIISNPSVLAKLRTEMDAYLQSQPMDALGHSIIPSARARHQLPYLQSCIREGLRIFPPFAGLLSKLVPQGGDTLAGRFVPGGTKIAMSTWAIQRSSVYGEDTDIFMPERWIHADDETEKRMLRTLGIVFGVGHYACLGKELSFMYVEKVVFEMIRRFDFTILNPLNPVQSRNMMVFMQEGMWLRISKREVDI